MITNQNYIGRAFRMFGDWKLQSQKLKEKFSNLNDSDLYYNTDTLREDSEKQLLRRLEIKLKKKRQEVIEIIQSVQTIILK